MVYRSLMVDWISLPRYITLPVFTSYIAGSTLIPYFYISSLYISIMWAASNFALSLPICSIDWLCLISQLKYIMLDELINR